MRVLVLAAVSSVPPVRITWPVPGSRWWWSTVRTVPRWKPASPTPARCLPATLRPGQPRAFPEGHEVAAGKHAPLAIKLTSDPSQYAWMLQMLRNCTAERYAVNKERMVRLSEYSRDCLDELRAETGIAYEGRTLGTTQLFRTQAQLDAAGKDIAVLEALRRALRGSRPRWHRPRRAGLGQGRRQAGRRLAPAQRPDRRLPAVHHPPDGNGQGPGRGVPLRPEHRAPGLRRRPHQRRAGQRRIAHRRPLRAGPGQLLAATARRWVSRLRSIR